MESNIILEGFKKSIEMHNLKYDSSVYKKIKDSKPHGSNFFIQIIECFA
jgi:hypothetical protein